MIVFREYDLLSKAEMAKIQLDDEGMWCMINTEYMSTSHPEDQPHVQLIIRECDAIRAHEILPLKEEECECEEVTP